MSRPFIYRFVRDLRLDDHAGLAAAAAQGEILPVLVIDRDLEARLAASPRRAEFYYAAVAALDRSLRERGSHLVVRRGPAGATLKQLARAAGAGGVAWSASYDGAGVRHDERLQSELEEAGLRALAVHDAAAIAPEETAAARSSGGNGYRAFVPYFEIWKSLNVATYEAPLLLRFASSDLQSEPVPESQARAGSSVAHDVLDRFLDESAMQYAVAMNVPSDDRTSHLSPHLSFGTIAARTVVRRALARLDDPFLLSEERASLRLFLRALAMRDFFLQLSWFHPETEKVALQEKMRDFTFAKTHPALDAWREGTTGFPLVDAGIRQLRATGWMHPHVRAVAASFLCFDLGVDWRVGCDEWERWMIEDDPSLAVGNWQWIAGVGADMAQYPRIYNPDKQRRRFDPTGAYVKTWIHELANVPMSALERSRTDSSQLSFELFTHDAYPQPVFDHDAVARGFLARYRVHLERAATDSPEGARRASR